MEIVPQSGLVHDKLVKWSVQTWRAEFESDSGKSTNIVIVFEESQVQRACHLGGVEWPGGEAVFERSQDPGCVWLQTIAVKECLVDREGNSDEHSVLPLEAIHTIVQCKHIGFVESRVESLPVKKVDLEHQIVKVL